MGKTSVAAATGVKLAELNHPTEAVVVAELTPSAGEHEEPVPRVDFDRCAHRPMYIETAS